MYKSRLCKKYCYANRGRFRFKNVEKNLDVNLRLSKNPDFVKIIDAQIALVRVLHGIKYVRIHSSGDFYSIEYFRKWCRIAAGNPGVKFLAYTRNTDINAREAPENLKLIYSMDISTEDRNPSIKRMAYVSPKHDNKEHLDRVRLKLGWFRVCKSKCKSCKVCWDSESNILFPQR